MQILDYLLRWIFMVTSVVSVNAIDPCKVNCAIVYECPKKELVNPCYCNSEGIGCEGNEAIQLKPIFLNLTSKLEDGKKHFRKFSLRNTAIDRLEDDMFGGITFDFIDITDSSNLSFVGSNVFGSISKTIEAFDAKNTPLNNNPPKYDIFTALSSMSSLQALNIFWSNIEEIPENAFRPINGQQNNLSTINLSNNKITKIGSNAFSYLNSLTELQLENNALNHISEKAFNFVDSSDRILYIFLNNCLLNSSSFEIGAFDHLKRPTQLFLNQFNDDTNEITFLDERVFASFLNLDKRNHIKLLSLDCNDCRSIWLVNTPKYNEQIYELTCSNGNQITNKNNFLNCSG